MSSQRKNKMRKIRLIIGKALARQWRALSGRRGGVWDAGFPAADKLVIQPLPIALRLDISLPVGGKGGVPASQLVWMTAAEEGRPKKALGVLLLSN
jgi:hypothetical protein